MACVESESYLKIEIVCYCSVLIGRAPDTDSVGAPDSEPVEAEAEAEAADGTAKS